MTAEPLADQLPDQFRLAMQELLPDDFDAFVASFGEPRSRGLRLNPAKITAEELAEILDTELAPLPWTPLGYLLAPHTRLGGHPAHLSGLFYLQEPSAMAVASALDPAPGSSVLDLAAAPGGKTTHLASLVGDDGLVVANEVVGSRLRPLHDNLDLWGATNVVTSNLPADQLAATGLMFDAVVLDAPCSGEALFRRDPDALRHWKPTSVEGAARRQRALLRDSAQMVRPGGLLIYSTCSFGLAENERQVADFLADTDGWTIEACNERLGASPGIPFPPAATEGAARFWPHRQPGEGQFVARMRRSDDRSGQATEHGGRRQGRGQIPRSTKVTTAWHEFAETYLVDFDAPEERLAVRGDKIWLLPTTESGLGQQLLSQPGMPLGRLRPGRFEPHPALAGALGSSRSADFVSWSDDSADLAAYLRGETIRHAGPNGWVLVCYRRWGIGWARRTKGVLKNLYPQHLRRQAQAHQRRSK